MPGDPRVNPRAGAKFLASGKSGNTQWKTR